MSLVVDASVGLKWLPPEPDSHLAEEMVLREPDLLVPDFWLHDATNVLWLQVRKKRFTSDEAREALPLLRAQIAPTPTADMALHEVALDIGIEVNHSTYDTLCMEFAVAMGASGVVLVKAPLNSMSRDDAEIYVIVARAGSVAAAPSVNVAPGGRRTICPKLHALMERERLH